MKIDYDVGDLVVCVDDRPTKTWGQEGIRRGLVYTVESFGEPLSNDLLGFSDAVFLSEVKSNSPWGFSALRFRKLPKKSQEFFTGDLQVTPDTVDA